MDPLPETWPSFSPDSLILDDDLMNIIQSDLGQTHDNNSNINPPAANQNPHFSNHGVPCSGAEAPNFKITVTFLKPGSQRTHFGKLTSDSSASFQQLISFGSSSFSSTSLTNGSKEPRISSSTNTGVIKPEPAAEMICFKKTDPSGGNSSSSSSSSSSFQELQQQWDIEDDDDDLYFGTLRDRPVSFKKCTRTPSQARDHVVAERKRRERLLQRFRDLSDMIPDLKKFDKVSILDGAIERLKYYEKLIQVKKEELEEFVRRKGEDYVEVESVVGDADVEVNQPLQLKKRKLLLQD